MSTPIDPNETLRTLREALGTLREASDVEEWDSSSEADEHVDSAIIRATDAFKALDEWIKDGGDLPEDWEEA